MSWDTDLVVALNAGFARLHWLRLADFIAFNPLVRSGPILYLLVRHWFDDDTLARRLWMVRALAATCFATVVSVWLQFHWTPHVRPFLDPALALDLVNPAPASLGRTSSFPSDTATLYFGLAAIVFCLDRAEGCFAFCWAFVTAGLCRIALGWH